MIEAPLRIIAMDVCQGFSFSYLTSSHNLIGEQSVYAGIPLCDPIKLQIVGSIRVYRNA